jgi:hypothetical protein
MTDGKYKTVTFTVEDFERLKVAYKDAVARGMEVFVFEGNDLYTGYAKYLIQYLEGKFYSPTRKNKREMA